MRQGGGGDALGHSSLRDQESSFPSPIAVGAAIFMPEHAAIATLPHSPQDTISTRTGLLAGAGYTAALRDAGSELEGTV